MLIRSEKTLRILSKIIFIIYIYLLIWVVIFKCNLINSIKLAYDFSSAQSLSERFMRFIIPFKDYTEDFFSNQIYILIKDDILNVLIFIPLGLYLSYFINDKVFIKVLLISVGLSLSFELIQLFTLLGSFATKDIATNFFGSLIGYFIYRLIFKKDNGEIKILILNIISIAVMVIFTPILIYGFIKTIKYFDIYIDVFLRRLNV